MTLYEYRMLDELEQLEAVWNFGIKLAERSETVFTYTLYAIDSFYVEVKRHINNEGYVDFRPFCSSTPLEPYLSQIDISGISPSSAS